jgi:hypothetical protein
MKKLPNDKEVKRPLPNARRCQSFRFTRWWKRKEYLSGKRKAEEEQERHSGSLIPTPLKRYSLCE